MTIVEKSEPDANGWMPIETAPKDQQILAWEPMYGWLLVACNFGQWEIKTSGNFWVDLPKSVTLTHWQPVPRRPTT